MTQTTVETLPERLRRVSVAMSGFPLLMEAADEIERLRATLPQYPGLHMNEPQITRPSMGAKAPKDSALQMGDRADKRCIDAAVSAVSGAITYDQMRLAIDAYLKVAEDHGWKMS